MGAKSDNQVKSLQATLQKMEVALGAIADAVVWTDASQQIQWCNAAFERLVHQVAAALIGTPLPQVLPLLNLSQLQDLLPAELYPDAQLQIGTYETTTFGFQHHQQIRQLEISGHPVVTELDQSSILVIRDVTPVAQALSVDHPEMVELRAQVEHLKTLIDATPDLLCFKDGEGRWLESNQANLNFLGLSGVNYRHKSDAELAELSDLYREVFPACASTDEQAWQRRSTSYSEEVVTQPDGTVSIMNLVKVPLFHPDGQRQGLVILGRDMTSYRQTEAALQANEVQYRDLVQAANCVILRWDTQGNIRFMNDYGLRLFGFEAQELLGQNVVGTIVPRTESSGRDLQMLMDDICHHPDRYLFNENENICKNGDRVWIVWSNKPVLDAKGNLIEILSIGTDTTDRKQVQVALQTSLSLLQATFESIQDGILAVDQSGQIVSYNQKFLEMWGIPPEILMEPNHSSRIQYLAQKLKEPAQFFDRVKLLYATPEASSYDLLELKDGRLFERYSCPQRLGDQILGRVWTFRDITEQKQAEAALKASELKYRNLFENSQVGIFRFQIGDGLILDANQRFIELTGYETADEVIGKLCTTDFYANPRDRQWVLEQLHQHGEFNDYEVLCRKRDGTLGWGLFSVRLNPTEHCVDGVVVDITDRKRLEEELRQSQHFLDSIINNIPLALFAKDIQNDFRYVLVNQSSERILGFSRAEALGHNDDELISADRADFHRAEDLSAIAQGGLIEIPEHWIETSSQDRILVRGWKFPLLNAAGQATHLLAISEDITERKRREQALRLIVEGTAAKTGDDFFRAFVHSLAEALRVRYVLVTEFVDATKTRVRTLALWGEGAIRENFEYDPQNAPCETVLQGEVGYYADHLQTLFPDDPDLALIGAESYLGMPLMNSSGQVLGHLAVMDSQPMERDLGRELILKIFAARAGAELERKQVDEALQRRAQMDSLLSNLSRQFIDQALETALPTTLEAIARFIGAERSCMYEYSEDQTQITLIQEWCAPGVVPLMPYVREVTSETFPWFHQQIARGQAVRISCLADVPPEAIAERALLDSHAIQSLMAVPTTHSGRVVGFLGLDVTHYAKTWAQEEVNLLRLVGELIAIGRARHQAEVALREAKEAAEAANRAKSTFLANMSHELRTPLNAILGFAQLMERDPTLTARQQEALTTINRSGEHLLNLINDVLEMSKIEAGRITFNPEPFDLHQLLHTLHEMFQVRAETAGLYLEFDLDPGLPQYVVTDEGKLRQVLINLLGNAVKFTERGKVTLRVQDQSDADTQSSSCLICFAVEDTGRGMAADEMEHLFQPFVQTLSGTRMSEGTGLGLAISRQFVQLMGGDIQMSSTLGQGSTFRFQVQVALTPQLKTIALSTITQRVVGLVPGQQSYRILVVDDRPENREPIRQLLETVGFEVRTAIDGQAALTLWQTWQPHLIWMDMRMPVMDGYAATREIRQQERQNPRSPQAHLTKIVALTASAFEEQRASILAAGCDDLVRKPFREQLIFDKMTEHLGVQYVYQDNALEPSEARLSSAGSPPEGASRQDELSLSSIAVMPTEWMLALRQAAIEVDAEQIQQLIRVIPSEQAALAKTLNLWVQHFCFDEILEFTESMPD